MAKYGGPGKPNFERAQIEEFTGQKGEKLCVRERYSNGKAN
jgi:hypothetical protein